MKNLESNNNETGDVRVESEDMENRIYLNGTWENKDRNITAAAFTGLIGIGALYFNAQSILTTVLVILFQSIYKIEMPGGLAEKLRIITSELKAPILISLVFSEFIFMMIPALWIVKRWHTSQIKNYIRLKFCSIKEIILAVLITVSLLPFCYFISSLIMNQFSIPEIFRDLGSQLFSADSTSQFIFLVLAIAVTPAICEEIFFRGYVQRTLERTLGLKSIFITGIIFGLVHMEPLSLITLSILGVLFSFFYFKSKSLLPSSASHFTNNLIALIYYNSNSKFIKINFPSGGNIPILWIITSLIISSMLFIVYIKTADKNNYTKKRIVEIIN